MFCKSCGSVLNDEYNICPECGTKKGEGTAFCESCGSARKPGMMFCAECGFNFAGTSAQPAAPVQAQAAPAPVKKFCRNCGKEINPGQAICIGCGVKVGVGESFCPHCGNQTQPGAAVCVSCGKALKGSSGSWFNDYISNITNVFKNPDKASIVFDFGTVFLSVLVFIFGFLPVISSSYNNKSASIGLLSNEVSLMSVDERSAAGALFGFAGWLIIISFVAAILRFEPHINKYIEEHKNGRFLTLVVPVMQFTSFLFMLIGMNDLTVYSKNYFLSKGSLQAIPPVVGFSAWGWILSVMIIAGVVFAVVSLFNHKQELDVPDFKTLALGFGSYALVFVAFILTELPSYKITVSAMAQSYSFEYPTSIVSKFNDTGMVPKDQISFGGIGFGRVMFIIAFIVAILMIVPFVRKFINKQSFAPFAGAVAPALMLLGTIVSFINCLAADGDLKKLFAIGTAVSVSFGFNFVGIITVVLVLGAAGLEAKKIVDHVNKSKTSGFVPPAQGMNNPVQNNINTPYGGM